jgi:Restriction endonuclease
MTKKREPSDVDRLYRELFGSVPKKSGTAYEMLSAIVLATLGWKDVVHDRTERPDGKRADHQLDVTCRHPDGSVSRLLIECKDWDSQDVGQDEMTKLWAVRDEIGASHAAMVTKRAFTKGARDTAVDHDAAMIRLRVYDPATDDGTWIRKVTANIEIGMTIQENVEVLVGEAWEPAHDLGIRPEGWMDVFDAAGARVGNVAGLFAAGEMISERDGETHKQLQLDAPLRIEGFDGLCSVSGMRWSEREVIDTTVVTSEASGTPRLLLQQLDENGEPYAGRVIVDEKLIAWRVEMDGRVTRVNPPTITLSPPPSEPEGE